MGRPLLGQWCWDILRFIDYLVTRDDVDQHHLALVGSGAAGLAAVCTGGFDERIGAVATWGTLASLVSPTPFEGQRMASFVPFLLDVGDVPQLAALMAPRRLVMLGTVDAQNRPLDRDAVGAALGWTEQIYRLCGAEDRLQVAPELPGTVLAELLRGA
jgi:hypothetical protein